MGFFHILEFSPPIKNQNVVFSGARGEERGGEADQNAIVNCKLDIPLCLSPLFLYGTSVFQTFVGPRYPFLLLISGQAQSRKFGTIPGYPLLSGVGIGSLGASSGLFFHPLLPLLPVFSLNRHSQETSWAGIPESHLFDNQLFRFLFGRKIFAPTFCVCFLFGQSRFFRDAPTNRFLFRFLFGQTHRSAPTNVFVSCSGTTIPILGTTDRLFCVHPNPPINNPQFITHNFSASDVADG